VVLRRLFHVPPVFALALFSAFCVSCANSRPVITSISPKFGSEGDIVTISGKYFGEAGEQSYITIAGERPTTSSYVQWHDDTIQVRITRPGVSGLVYVFVEGRQSNGVVFSDREAIPQRPVDTAVKSGPTITAVNPKTVSPGEILTITGGGFGVSRENAGVFFTWDITGQAAGAVLPASAFEGGYESWGEHEIRVRVPDGAGSGVVQVVLTDENGQEYQPSDLVVPGSQITLDISQSRGKKLLREGREYIVTLSADVIARDASLPNTLFLAIPQPVQTASQQITRNLSRSSEPFAKNYRGTTLYKLSDMRPGAAAQISVSYLVSVYTVETTVAQTALTQDGKLPVYRSYLGTTPFIPAGNPDIQAKAAAIAGRERNPYAKAQIIYRTLLRELSVNPAEETGQVSDAALQALKTGAADSFGASLLFCALCRAAGIPAAPYAGVLVNTDRSTAKHYWAAFWLDGLGWLPVDIVFGAGFIPDGWTRRTDYAAWYFGNMDNQRIAFSFGETTLSPIDNNGRVVGRDRSYALQNIWEEATGGLEAYSSLWSDVSISGVYYH
jgi:hypothetical protein